MGSAPSQPQPEPPRESLSRERWKDIEALATRLAIPLTQTSRKLLVALAEGKGVHSTELRGSHHKDTTLLAALLSARLTVVVAPETAALEELREKAERAALPSALLASADLGAAANQALDRIASGATRIVLLRPRALVQETVRRTLATRGVGLLVVLEAHRLSSASPDFSPAYAKLPQWLESLAPAATFAVSPGGDSAAQQDVEAALFHSPPVVFAGPRVRPNVTVSVKVAREEARQRAVLEAVRALPKPLLVLSNTPREAEHVATALRSAGESVFRYHEELPTGVRAGEALQFGMPGEKSVLVATSAFALRAPSRDEDPEGVPLRYGRRTRKLDIRSLVRTAPPASLEQLGEELSLLGRDGQPARALVLCDASDRPRLVTEVEAARPTGEHLLSFGKALEAAEDSRSPVTMEALAQKARSSRRAMETVAALLDDLGLTTGREGWLSLLAPDHVVLRELRALAERLATVRSLDGRRIAEVGEWALSPGCHTAKLRHTLGEDGVSACGACAACSGAGEADGSRGHFERHAPARRFMVSGVTEGERVTASTFHSDRRQQATTPLTAKLADFN